MMESKPLSIYVHIPFCEKKCLYCDFISEVAADETKEIYVQDLLQEIQAQSQLYKDRQVKTVFFGGGTPSLLSCNQIERIIEMLNRCYCMKHCTEMTLEVNPATVDAKKLQCYMRMKINRLSMGLQSVNNKELSLLGRIHTYEEFLETYHIAREVGFLNVNVDVMAAIPSQTIETYQETLKKVSDLNPQHISSYSLIVEEGTPFYELYGDGECIKVHPSTGKVECLVPEEEERQMYEYTKSYLTRKGYNRYEISNYAKEGFECKHNNVYWQRGDYLGFGQASASMIDNVRWSSNEKRYSLTKKDQMEEYFFLGLRRMEGVSYKRFQENFSADMEHIYGAIISGLQEEKLLERDGDWLRLTGKGIDVSNYVFAKFL